MRSAVPQSRLSAIARSSASPSPWWDSPWGEADRLGNVNNLSAEGVKKAAGLVKTGKVYALGVPTAPESAAYGTRKYTVERQPGPALETSYANAGEVSPGYSAPWAGPGVPRRIGIVWSRSTVRIRLVTVLLREAQSAVGRSRE